MPAAVAGLWRPRRWLPCFGWLMLGMVVDLDHLLADPLYDPLRCSMGFHPLHTWPAVLVYAALFAYGRTRVLGAGLLIHMLLDSGDCLLMPGGAGNLEGFLSWIP